MDTQMNLQPDHGSLWRDWTISCATGELIGIGVAALSAQLLLLRIGEPATTVQRWGILVLMVGAGLIEGSALGYFQWRVLKRLHPAISARSWIGVTVAVAAVGWFLGMLPSTLYVAPDAGAEPFDPSLLLTVVLAMLTGLGAGAVFGVAQWFVLRHHVQRASLWIVANMLGWMLGIAWIYAVAALPTETTATGMVIALGIIGGIMAGLSLGAVTGWFLLKLNRTSTAALI